MADKDDTKDDEKDKPAVSFKTEGEFLHAVEKRSAKMIEKAVKAARAEFHEALGLDEGDSIDDLKTTLAKSKTAKTEIETAHAEIKKLTSKLKDAEKANAELLGFKDRTMRTEALAPYAKRFRDPEDMNVHLAGKIVIAEDGKVTAPDGAPLDKWIDSFLEAKPHLRSPDFKAGPGTSKVPSKAPPGPGNQENKNGEKPGYKPGDLTKIAMEYLNGDRAIPPSE